MSILKYANTFIFIKKSIFLKLVFYKIVVIFLEHVSYCNIFRKFTNADIDAVFLERDLHQYKIQNYVF